MDLPEAFSFRKGLKQGNGGPVWRKNETSSVKPMMCLIGRIESTIDWISMESNFVGNCFEAKGDLSWISITCLIHTWRLKQEKFDPSNLRPLEVGFKVGLIGMLLLQKNINYFKDY